MLVVDLRHWMLPSGELEPRARLAPHIAMVVECATICLGDVRTAMVCRHRDGRRRCAGQVCVSASNDTIEWGCSACDDAGVITGWRGTLWDLRDIDIGPDDEEHAVYLPLEELRALRDLGLIPTIRAALAIAMVVDERNACVPLTEAELTSLIEAISNASMGGVARRRLDRSLGRAEQVLVTHQLERRARAH